MYTHYEYERRGVIPEGLGGKCRCVMYMAKTKNRRRSRNVTRKRKLNGGEKTPKTPRKTPSAAKHKTPRKTPSQPKSAAKTPDKTPRPVANPLTADEMRRVQANIENWRGKIIVHIGGLRFIYHTNNANPAGPYWAYIAENPTESQTYSTLVRTPALKSDLLYSLNQNAKSMNTKIVGIDNFVDARNINLTNNYVETKELPWNEQREGKE